ncbi:Flagellar biosynthetic protein FlhB [Chlamydiales bacterium SCGC AG-110-M15]|nr:Flagellar biosynthetic protein FlhB [Chlamydiales bacterium SCGC AG-110-M15]
MAEKTEKATPKKLRDARKKGQVAKSQDFPSAFTFVVSIATTMAFAPTIFNHIGGFFIDIYTSIPDLDFEVMSGYIMYRAMMTIFMSSLPVLIVVASVGVLVNFLIIGPVFSVEVFKPNIKKFNPVTNIKQKFKLKTLVELIKSIVKIVVAGYLIYTVMWDSIPVIIGTVRLPVEGALIVFQSFLFKVIIKVGIFFMIVAVADLIYQRHNFANEMKMEKHEIKQEYKNTEGDPHIKGKRKEIAREIAYSAGPEKFVKMAKAIVTNPVHLAVALAYEKEKDPAPYIVAMGSGLDATLIVKEAERIDIPILRNIPLAHQLFDEGKLNTYVPIDTYEAIAEILKWVSSLSEKEEELEYDGFEYDEEAYEERYDDVEDDDDQELEK